MMKILKAALSGFWEGVTQPVPDARFAKRELNKRSSQIEAEMRRKARIEAEGYQAALRGRTSR